MTFMSKESEELLAKLVSLAGSPIIVEDSLRELGREMDSAPNLEQLISRILEKRAAQVRRAAQPELATR